jgi:ribosomal protein S18 acetylase RimI-like enzyme
MGARGAERPALPLRRATRDDRTAVVRMLVRAFDRDPVANWLLRSDAHRARAFEAAFDVSLMRLTLPAGEVWLAGDAQGAALWTPPGGWSTTRAIPALPRLAGAVGWKRSLALLGAVTGFQDHHPHEAHWYLFLLGVDPDHQGRGVGGALLRAILDQCDARGEVAYLEASSEGNARLYERHGFVTKAEVRLLPDAPPLWPMVRAAKAARNDEGQRDPGAAIR